MFDRDDLIGLLLLGLCVAVGGVLVYGIATGTRFRFDGPGWLGWVLLILFLGAGLYGLLTAAGRRWPDPRTGREGWRRWWPWSRRDRPDR